jgi:hypothetical protein
MLISAVFEFTRPKNSSMIFGGVPAAGITVGFEILLAILNHGSRTTHPSNTRFSALQPDVLQFERCAV